MYDLEVTDLQKLEVRTRKYSFHYAIDGSKENPLEATYAALSGCAGVYTLKACKKLGVSPLGIKISGKPFLDKSNPLMMTKWFTSIQFPLGWVEENKQLVIQEIQRCAVKELIAHGPQIEFLTEESSEIQC